AWYVQFREGREKPALVREFSNLKEAELDRYLLVLRGIEAVTPAKEKALLKDFAITGKTIQDELHLTLEPRKASDIVRVTLIFKQSQDALYRAILEDSLGNTTTITLNDP